MLHASPQTNCTKKINAKQPHCIVRPNMRKKGPQRQLIFLQAMDLEFAARTSIGLGWHLILLTDFKLTVSAIKLSLSPTLANLDKRNRAFLLTDSSRLYFEWRVKTGENNRSIALKRRRGIVWIRSAKDSDCKISSTTQAVSRQMKLALLRLSNVRAATPNSSCFRRERKQTDDSEKAALSP